MEFSAYTEQWKRADGTIVGVQERGDLDRDQEEQVEQVGMSDEKHRNLLIFLGATIGLLVAAGLISLAILKSNWQTESDNRVQNQKTELCRSIEDDATRALCIQAARD